MNNNNTIQKAIIKVIAFFDLFDYPLTEYEIWKYLDKKCELQDVTNELKKFNNLMQKRYDFYFFKNRECIVDKRINRRGVTKKKIKKALWVCKIFKFIPWIKMVAIGNIIGTYNLNEQSDIDLFIITKNNKIWTTRFFCVGLLTILGIRPKENNKKDKLCPSFFITEGAMDLSQLMLYNNSEDILTNNIDIYFIYWLTGLVVIYDVDKTYEKFIGSNSWIKQCLPNWQGGEKTEETGAGHLFHLSAK
ncbi:MAG: hypothetical protein V1768_00770 [Patescibacteria group bacterium]